MRLKDKFLITFVNQVIITTSKFSKDRSLPCDLNESSKHTSSCLTFFPLCLTSCPFGSVRPRNHQIFKGSELDSSYVGESSDHVRKHSTLETHENNTRKKKACTRTDRNTQLPLTVIFHAQRTHTNMHTLRPHHLSHLLFNCNGCPKTLQHIGPNHPLIHKLLRQPSHHISLLLHRNSLSCHLSHASHALHVHRIKL